jgi:heat shock protein HslJ
MNLNSCSSSKNLNLTSLLQGKSFNVESIAGNLLNAENFKNGLPTFNFGSDGKLSGNAGCNNFNGNFKVDGSKLSMNPGAMTRMACPGSGESDFLNALKQVTGVKQVGSKLKLLNGANEIMSLVPKP